jgi:hypothetical protein
MKMGCATISQPFCSDSELAVKIKNDPFFMNFPNNFP